MEKGNHYFRKRESERRKPDALAQDLLHARCQFLKAKETLDTLRGSHSIAHARVFFRLMNVEADMSYDKRSSIEERTTHLQRATEYGVQAALAAEETGTPAELAHVQLEQAIVDGRRAEMEAKSGTSALRVRAMKDAAIQAITRALDRIAESDEAKFHENRASAEYWKARLLV